MANSFSKQETVAFDKIMEGFEDQLALVDLVSKFETDQVTMERSNDIMWRPMPYIAVSYTGSDQTSNFDDYTQLCVPASIDTQRSVPWAMSATELRDALQNDLLGKAAKDKLASDINLACLTRVSNEGTLFVKIAAAASGYSDLAECDAIMNEQGVPNTDRKLVLASRDYNSMANELSKASRSLDNETSIKALRESSVGRLAGFDTYKLDYAIRKTAAAGGAGLTISTLPAAGNYYVPAATSQGSAGQQSNVDNRYQTVTLSSTTSVAAGDAFTIAGVEAAHHVTKSSTGRLKTFRVIRVLSGTTMVISPPLISNQGVSDAEAQNVNVVMSSTSATAAIVFLNTVTNTINPFWCKDAIEILPGRLVIDQNAGAGVLYSTTSNGIQVVMQKQFNIQTQKTFFRLDTRFGTVLKQPEMAGLVMFSQT